MILLQVTDIAEKVITTIVMQLFILSTISERVTNFIKLNLQSVTERLGNFRDKENSQIKEKEREKGILNWAIVIGILVAVLAKADLFYMVKEGKLQQSWVDINILGCLLTGFFISLGSKFWHDLLDLLLQVKNLKSKLVDQKDIEFSKIEEFDEFMATYEANLVKKVLAERHSELFAIQGVVGVVIRTDTQGIYCEVAVTNDNVVLPQNYVYNYPPGRVKFLNIKKLLTTPIRIMAQKFQIQPGEEIGIVATSGISGTLGCLVYQAKEPLWLTCYHVVKSPKQDWESYNPIKQIDKVENPDKKPENEVVIIGNVKEGRRNLVHDIALITPDINTIKLDADILGGINKVTLFREVTEADENKTKVKKFGTTTGLTHGIIDKVGYSSLIDYSDGAPHQLLDLIRIRSLDIQDPFSRPGDSGALVVDKSNQAIGIIVAGSDDGEYSFAIPVSSVFDQFNLQLNP